MEAIASHRGRPGGALREGADRDRRHRPEHGEEDPRVLPGGARSRSSRSCGAKYPPEFVELGAHPRPRPQDAAAGCAASSASATSTTCAARSTARSSARCTASGRRPSRSSCSPLERRGRDAARSSAGRSPRRCRSRASWCAALEALPGVERAQYCGSLRRLRETVADVDIVVASREPSAVREAFLTLPTVREVIGSGDTKTSVLTATGLQVDLRIVEPRSVRRRLPVLHGLEGAQHQAAAARPRAGLAAQRVRPQRRADGRGDRLARRRRRSTARSGSRSSRRRCARTGARSSWPRRASCPPRSGSQDVRGDLHVHTTLSGDGRSPLEEVVAARRRARATSTWRSPTTPRTWR